MVAIYLKFTLQRLVVEDFFFSRKETGFKFFRTTDRSISIANLRPLLI